MAMLVSEIDNSQNCSGISLTGNNNCNVAITADQLPGVIFTFSQSEWTCKSWRMN